MVDDDAGVDFYEVLQVSSNADPDTIHRVYRFLAQRFHPDNQESGNEARFREVHQAYTVISDPERRARYDVAYQRRRAERLRLVTAGAKAEDDFELEQMLRLTLLEALYAKRRMEPSSSGIWTGDLETLVGRPREHLEFTVWYLQQKKYVTRDDNSRVQITADGVEYLEQNYKTNLTRRRLTAGNPGQTP